MGLKKLQMETSYYSIPVYSSTHKQLGLMGLQPIFDC
jgi:hypothetical protein